MQGSSRGTFQSQILLPLGVCTANYKRPSTWFGFFVAEINTFLFYTNTIAFDNQ